MVTITISHESISNLAGTQSGSHKYEFESLSELRSKNATVFNMFSRIYYRDDLKGSASIIVINEKADLKVTHDITID